ncbi:hypothetical protein [Streptomyces europaeiscabiei]|uniref:hypothetical protein n=1 Tax=Streptomyces europaeiscabiei TaxID=146819 RepID=UPI0038F6E536
MQPSRPHDEPWRLLATTKITQLQEACSGSLAHNRAASPPTYALPATEGKRDDPRWLACARRYGFDIDHPVQWEVEALEPDELQRLILTDGFSHLWVSLITAGVSRWAVTRRSRTSQLESGFLINRRGG